MASPSDTGQTRSGRGRPAGSVRPSGTRSTAIAIGLAVILVLAACTGTSGPPSSRSSPTRAAAPVDSAPDRGWATVDRDLAAMGPDVGFLAARVDADGTCEPIHAVHPTAPHPIASHFKLFEEFVAAGVEPVHLRPTRLRRVRDYERVTVIGLRLTWKERSAERRITSPGT